MNEPHPGSRWKRPVLRHGPEFDKLWTELLLHNSEDVLLISGLGFDPRMCLGAEKLIELGGSGRRDCILITYDDAQVGTPAAANDAIESNRARMQSALESVGNLDERRIEVWSEDGLRRVGPRRIADLFGDLDALKGYDHVVVDISSFPRTYYIPLVAKLLLLVDNAAEDIRPNLHVIVFEDPSSDAKIGPRALADDASSIHGFEPGIGLEENEHLPRIWMPILGEGRSNYFNRIYDYVKPMQVNPILPFPSREAKRGDDLLVEYRQSLVDVVGVQARDILYAHESNPFDVYRRVVAAAIRYQEALKELGGCQITLSLLSSKLTSLGGLLAAYDLRSFEYKVGIAHVQASEYELLPHGIEPRGELNEVWLAGKAYDPS